MKNFGCYFLVFSLATRAAFGLFPEKREFGFAGGYCFSLGTVSTHGFGGSTNVFFGKHEIDAMVDVGFGRESYLMVQSGIGGNSYYAIENRNSAYKRFSLGIGFSYYYYPLPPIANLIAIAPGICAGVWRHHDCLEYILAANANIFQFGGPLLKVSVGRKSFFWNNEVGVLLNFSKYTPRFRSGIAVRL